MMTIQFGTPNRISLISCVYRHGENQTKAVIDKFQDCISHVRTEPWWLSWLARQSNANLMLKFEGSNPGLAI